VMTHNRIIFTQLKVSQLSFVGLEASGYLLSLLKWIMPLLKIMYALIVTDTAQYVMLGGVTCIDNQQGAQAQPIKLIAFLSVPSAVRLQGLAILVMQNTNPFSFVIFLWGA
jgi:hypothetical protein